MGFKFDKQTALKGMLLVAVLGNISFKPVMKSLDLSSEAMSGGSAPPVVTRAAAKPVPVPAAADAPMEAVEPAAETAPPVETPAAPVEKPKRVETPKICGQRFYVVYTEKVIGNEVFTEVLLKPHTGLISGFRPVFRRTQGGFDINLDNADVKKDNDDQLVSDVRKRLGRCPGDQPPPVVDNGGETERRHPRHKDREHLERDIRECRKSSNGDPLPEEEVTQCHLDSLEDIDWHEASAMSQFERIISGDLRKSIKNRLMSTDSGKVEEGEDLLKQTIRSIDDAQHEIGRDRTLMGSSTDLWRRFAEMKGSLNSLRIGGEFYRKSANLDEQIKSARDDVREQLRQAKADANANPNNPQAQRNLLNLQNQILQQQQQLQFQARRDIGQSYAQMQAAQNMGYLSAGEYGQFAAPYQSMQTDLISMLDTNGILNINPALPSSTSPIAPAADFMSFRQKLSSEYQRSYGSQYNQTQYPLNLNSTTFSSSPMTQQLQNNGSAFQSYNPSNTVGGRRF